MFASFNLFKCLKMTQVIENQSCILVEFPEEGNEEFVGLEEWIKDENLGSNFFENIEKEPKTVKLRWRKNYQKLEMKGYLNNRERHEWTKDKKGFIRSRGTWTQMIEKQKTNKKYGTYEFERSLRKTYTKKNYSSKDEGKEKEDERIKKKRKRENQQKNKPVVSKKKKK